MRRPPDRQLSARGGLVGHFHAWSLAFSNGSQAGMSAHGAQLRQLIELRARINRELAPAQHYGSVTNNVVMMGEVTELLRILKAFPEACRAVVDFYAKRSTPLAIEGTADAPD